MPSIITQDSAANLPPSEELVNLSEFEDIAREVLSRTTHDTITDPSTKHFDHMTFRQRLMVNAMDLDLSIQLFGKPLFAPIIVGPIAQQKRFHADGEIATLHGAGQAKATVILSSDASVPVHELPTTINPETWFQVYAGDKTSTSVGITAAKSIRAAVLCITFGEREGDKVSEISPQHWDRVCAIKNEFEGPVVLKGILSRREAETAVERKFSGIILSSHNREKALQKLHVINSLPAIAKSINGALPILVDGNFRRGSDVLKALALGAQAVLLGRPIMWGLASYGASGVQAVLELLYNELARSMAASGRPKITDIDRTLVKFHRR
tara:strand:- start:1198 stop:2172 length:975 start_codon:yes stop_codon:yes gene_type:complete